MRSSLRDLTRRVLETGARIPERGEGVGSKIPEAHGGGLEREERTE